MALSVYVHIPYCLQRCRYCDFTTFEQSEIMPPERYVDWVLQEIRHRRSMWRESAIETLYFGGGTPSLLSPPLIVAICGELANAGFTFAPGCETTLEINPATVSEDKLEQYVRAGFNRFSVGAQTFNDALLKMCGRRHSAEDTRNTLRLLRKYDLNYSFDLLFALPGQTLADVARDLEEVAGFAPPHLSAYCLTVPEGHPMSRGRPPEDEQVVMFERIEEELDRIGLMKYEISNFAKPGQESRHNMAYWRDRNYWGIGLSSHSYLRAHGDFGLRFWNPKSLTEYGRQIERGETDPARLLPADQWESLKEHEALTDFCHMFLRTTASGLPEEALRNKFSRAAADQAIQRLNRLVDQGLVTAGTSTFRLTPRGQLISNKVFEELTFLANDLPQGGLTQTGSDSYCSV
jgi:oxygen-independent coproporphyrinogen-3 oxidase